MAIYQAGCKSSGGGAGEEHQVQFFGQGSVGNKWLSLGANSKTSDMVPYVVVDDVEFTAWSWANDDSTLDVDIEIYKNGTAPGNLIATYSILNKKTIAKSDITAISLSHGDRISIYINRNGGSSTNATDPLFTMYLNVITETSSEVTT